jgi:hypothetical protein
MKKIAFICRSILTAFILVLSFSISNAQSQSSVKSVTVLENYTAPSFSFSVSIPDEFSQKVIRENVDNSTYFKFKKSDGTTLFLFQVSKIPETQWLTVKDQVPGAKLVAHRNGFIYYTAATDKSRISGPDHDAYEEVYSRLSQFMSTVNITE